MKNELAGIKVGELDGVVRLYHLFKNADILSLLNFDGEKCISFIAEEVAAERQERQEQAGDWCLDIC